MKKFFRSLLSLLCIPKCCGCGVRFSYDSEECLCPQCLSLYEAMKEKECGYCGRSLHACLCRPHALQQKSILAMTKLGVYYPGEADAPVNRMLFALKERASSRLLDFLARELADQLSPMILDPDAFYLTFAPRTPKNIRRHGFDHMQLLCARVAADLGIAQGRTLRRIRGKEQKHLNAAERKENVKLRFIPSAAKKIEGKTVILLDDIMTTSATLTACTQTLRANGAKRMIVSVIALTRSAYRNLFV